VVDLEKKNPFAGVSTYRVNNVVTPLLEITYVLADGSTDSTVVSDVPPDTTKLVPESTPAYQAESAKLFSPTLGKFILAALVIIINPPKLKAPKFMFVIDMNIVA